MRKSVLTHIVIFVVAVFCGSFLAKYLNEEQLKIMPSYGLVAKAPAIGGFQKFASDVEWMLFINYLGSLSTVDKDNIAEVAKRLDKILSYDPNFEKAYQVGVLSISNADPSKAIEFLDKACENDQFKNNWQLPFYAGFIISHSDVFKENEAMLNRAVDFYKKAIQRSSKPEHYVINSYIRAKAKVDTTMKNPNLRELNVLLTEWKNSKNGRDFESTSFIPDLNRKIIKAAQDAKENAPDDKEVAQFINDIMKEVFNDQHICFKCLFMYGPGEKFCSSCGEKVELYGTCAACGAVLKGACCSACGTKAVVAPKAAPAAVPAPVADPKAASAKQDTKSQKK